MRRAGAALAVAALCCAPLVVAGPAVAHGADAPNTSPIVSVAPDSVLDCTTSSVRSDWLQFFAFNLFAPADSCATVVSVEGFGLFGPPAFSDGDGTIGGTPLIPFDPVSQTTVAPSPANGSTLTVVTVVSLPGTGLLLRQRDTYVNGQDAVLTSVQVENDAAVARDVVVYRTGDCFPGSDIGFGISGHHSVGCEQAVQDGLNAVPVAGPVYMRWTPTRGASHFDVGAVTDLRGAIRAGGPLADTCTCSNPPQDIAAALSWSLHIATAASATVAHQLTYSVRAGRDRPNVVAGAVVKKGVTHLTAVVTSAGHPISGATIDFVVGSLTACTGVTKHNGEASCVVAGPAPQYVARYRGDTTYQPANANYTPNPLPPPPPDPPGFPACGHFDRTGPALVTGGDTHSEEVAVATDAPPCPIVQYTAYGNGVVIGEMRGDLRTVSLIGEPLPGMAALFIDEPFGAVGPGCIFVTATDTRTGVVLDTLPAPGDSPPCLVEVEGQKFR
jgi:hypothetical protein